MATRSEGVDAFLNSGGDRSRGGSKFFSGWKKDKAAKIWLHRKTWYAKSWNHPIPCVVEFKDKETDDKSLSVWTERWGCHETESLLKERYDRDRTTGARRVPPTVCPSCIFAEVVRGMVQSGQISWTDVLFEWDGVDKEGKDANRLIMAGGIYNAFNSKEVDRNRELVKELRRKNVNRKDSWDQSMLARMQWLFCVVNADKIEDGLMKTIESKGLGEKMKIAIRDEMDRNPRDRSLGDPTANPYPFAWKYDEEKLFDDKYHVLALTQEKPSAEVLALIDGPALDIDDDLAPGNCWWLKNELESHYVGKHPFPWEKVFEAADKAGLMKPPEDSKSEANEDEDDDATEIGRGGDEAGGPRVYAVGPDHEVWFEDAKPDPKVRGAFIELEAPEAEEGQPAPTDAEIKLVVELLAAWGAAEVAHVVQCDHCNGRMTTADIDCPVCGAEYDEAGKLVARPCIADKSHRVLIEGEGPTFICGTCATIHALAPETADTFGAARWTKVVPKVNEKPKEEAPTRRRRASAEAATPEKPKVETPTPPAATTRTRRGAGVPFDMAKK